MYQFTIDDLLEIFNSAGFTSLQEAKAGFQIMALVNKRLQVENARTKKQAEQQQKIADTMAASNPELESLNAQLIDINTQIAKLQGLG